MLQSPPFLVADFNSCLSFLHSRENPEARRLRRRQSCWPTNPSWSRLNLVFPTSRRRCSSLSVRNGLRTAPGTQIGWFWQPLEVIKVHQVDADLRRVGQFNDQVSSINCGNGDKPADGFTILDSYDSSQMGMGKIGKILQKSVTSQIEVLGIERLAP